MFEQNKDVEAVVDEWLSKYEKDPNEGLRALFNLFLQCIFIHCFLKVGDTLYILLREKDEHLGCQKIAVNVWKVSDLFMRDATKCYLASNREKGVSMEIQVATKLQ